MHPRTLTGVVAVLVAGACYAVGPVDTPDAYIAAEQPSQIWVVVPGDTTLLVERPQLLVDTVVGFVGGEYREVPLANVREVRARRLDLGRTAGLVAALVAGVGMLGFLLMRRRAGAPAP